MADSQHTFINGPFPVIDFFGVELPTYNVFISLTLSAMLLYAYKRAESKDQSPTTALDLFIFVVLGGSIGARLLHIVYEAPDYYLDNPLEIFYIWQGGFVYYGGLICGLLAGWITLLYKKESFLLWADFFAPIGSLGYGLGRIACFLAGCCYGSTCDLPWAYPFREYSLLEGSMQLSYRHPTQLYAAFSSFAIFFFLIWLERNKKFTPGVFFCTWLILHALSRIFMELFRDDPRGLFILNLSISTWISLGLIIGSFIFIFKKPVHT